eukprot:Skav226101  [mRNA]  locus=scaffold4179:72145:73863:- [translate_table: standard]
MPPKRGDFQCTICGFRCRTGYDYFGKDPPFDHAAIRQGWLEDIYALKNPPPACTLFRSPEEYGAVRTICLGAPCSVCANPVCVDEKCSLFYQSRFCKSCVQQAGVVQAKSHFPCDVAEGLAKDLRKLLD